MRLGAALARALLEGDGGALAHLAARLDPPRADGAAEALLDAAQAWPGEEAAAALRDAAEAIAVFEVADLLGAPAPGRLARLLGAEHPMRQARRRLAEAEERLAPAEARLAEGLARLDAGLLRLDRARAAATAQAEAIGALLAEADHALKATAARAEALRGSAEDAGFAPGEAAARFLGQREAIAARRHELAVARAAAEQAAATATLLAARDRALAGSIRSLREEVLPRWHLQAAETIALLGATGAAATLRGLGGDDIAAARQAVLDAIARCAEAATPRMVIALALAPLLTS